VTVLRDELQRTLGTSYTLERELGGGGMSSVFVARDNALGRAVVVKVLPYELAAAVSVDRFKREIMLSAALQHPHIVPVLTAGEIPADASVSPPTPLPYRRRPGTHVGTAARPSFFTRGCQERAAPVEPGGPTVPSAARSDC